MWVCVGFVCACGCVCVCVCVCMCMCEGVRNIGWGDKDHWRWCKVGNWRTRFHDILSVATGQSLRLQNFHGLIMVDLSLLSTDIIIMSLVWVYEHVCVHVESDRERGKRGRVCDTVWAVCNQICTRNYVNWAERWHQESVDTYVCLYAYTYTCICSCKNINICKHVFVCL